MSIPNGLQRHVLWNMDGRMWIENINAVNEESKAFQHSLQRGFVKYIPQDKLAKFIVSLNDGDRADAPVQPAAEMPDWASSEGPWCLKQWVSFNVAPPLVDICLLDPEHDGDCRGVLGTRHNHSMSFYLGHLQNKFEEEQIHCGRGHPTQRGQEGDRKLSCGCLARTATNQALREGGYIGRPKG